MTSDTCALWAPDLLAAGPPGRLLFTPEQADRLAQRLNAFSQHFGNGIGPISQLARLCTQQTNKMP